MIPGINLLTVFTTGLLTGGLTCIAVQGGVLTAAILQGQEQRTKNKELRTAIAPVLAFIISKLIAYTILGFLLGWVGSLLQISLQMRILLQFAVVVFMLGTAFNLLGIYPFFRYFVINPPRFLMKMIYKKSEDPDAAKASSSKQVFAAALLGFLTVFIPCGATQAMMALSVGTGQPLTGALIMFVFVLGTSPVFLLLGLFTIRIGGLLNRNFIKAAASILIIFSLFNLDATLALSNSPVTIRSAANRFYCLVSFCDHDLSLNPVSEQTILFSPTGYSPSRFAVRKGERITLHLVNENAAGCIQSFTISSLGIQKIVLPNESVDITFTAPNEPGRINFTCSQGLYPGVIEVI